MMLIQSGPKVKCTVIKSRFIVFMSALLNFKNASYILHRNSLIS